MKNIYLKGLILGLIVTTGVTSLRAQESNTLQLMKGMPQSNFQNPALHTDSSSVVIGLPGFSGMYFDVNSGFAVNDLIHNGTGLSADSLEVDMEGFHNKLKPTNNIVQNFSMPLFYFGLRNKSSFFSLGITEKEVTRFSFDKSFVTFIKDGNAPYMGQNYDLGNFNINALHYREYAVGYSKQVIKNKLTLGIKAKVLYGKFGYQTERMDMKVNTAADGSSIILNSDMKVNMSLPVTVQYDAMGYFSDLNGDNMEPKEYVLQKGNTGMAFDLGAVYRLNPKINFYGSIIDIGKISFKKDLNNLTYTASYKWEGLDLSNSMDKTKPGYVDPSDILKNEGDKIADAFKPKKSDFSSKAFSMAIPMKIYLGGSYALNDKVNFGLLERLYKNGDFTQNTLTLSANTMIANFLSLSGSYSAIGNSYDNLGLGMAIRMGFFQIFVVGDNVLAISPARAQYANVRLGTNFLFGRKHAHHLD